MHRADRHGFTLIELLVVIAIVMILVGITIPAIRSVRESARKAQTVANMKVWAGLIALHATNMSTYGRLPPIAGGNKMLYDQTDGLVSLFEEHGVQPRAAYSPSTPALGSAYGDNEWYYKRWITMMPDWTNAVAIDNSGDGSITGPPQVNTVLGPVDDQDGAGKFSASGWASETVSGATNGQVSYHDGGNSTATWTFKGSELPEGSGSNMALTARVYKSPDGHPSVKYTISGPGGEMGSTIVSHYAETPGWHEEPLGFYAIESGSDYTVTVEGQGAGSGGGTTIDWSAGLILDDEDSPSYLTLNIPTETSLSSADLPTKWYILQGLGVHYGNRSLCTSAAGAKFTYAIPTTITKNTSGTVTLSAFIRKDSTNRATQVSYSLVASDGSATANPTSCNYSHAGSSAVSNWFEIGTFEIPAQASDKNWVVVVEKTGEASNSGPPRVWLDAIKLVGNLTPAVGGSRVRADSVKLAGGWVAPGAEPTEPGYYVQQGVFIVSVNSPNYFGTNYHVAVSPNSDPKRAAWYFRPQVTDHHLVYGMWPGVSGCNTDSKFTIFSDSTPSGRETSGVRQNDTTNNKGIFTEATKANAPWRELCPGERFQFTAGQLYRIELNVPVGASHTIADAICIVPEVEEHHERGLIGYLYLGYRDPVPGSVPSGAPDLQSTMPRNFKDCASPSSTPLLVDLYAENNRDWTSHTDGIHVMHVDGSVVWKDASELQPRWTDLYGTTFSW